MLIKPMNTVHIHTKIIIKKKIIQSMHELNSPSLLARYTNTQINNSIYVQIQLKIKTFYKTLLAAQFILSQYMF